MCGFSGTTKLRFYSDTSKNTEFGIGAYFNGKWLFAQWEPDYIVKYDPSIEYLELLALCTAVFTWQQDLANKRVTIFCDNNSVCTMVNNSTSGCKNCMKLIRLLVLNNLRHNSRIFVKHIFGSKNVLADALSRMNFKQFWKHAPENTCTKPEKLPKELWPPSKLWIE